MEDTSFESEKLRSLFEQRYMELNDVRQRLESVLRNDGEPGGLTYLWPRRAIVRMSGRGEPSDMESTLTLSVFRLKYTLKRSPIYFDPTFYTDVVFSQMVSRYEKS